MECAESTYSNDNFDCLLGSLESLGGICDGVLLAERLFCISIHQVSSLILWRLLAPPNRFLESFALIFIFLQNITYSPTSISSPTDMLVGGFD